MCLLAFALTLAFVGLNGFAICFVLLLAAICCDVLMWLNCTGFTFNGLMGTFA